LGLRGLGHEDKGVPLKSRKTNHLHLVRLGSKGEMLPASRCIPFCPQQRTWSDYAVMSVSCPCVDGSGLARAFFTVLQHWSVQPCVRPFDAVHMTAGHNALRGSGPDQQLAFKNALARVGCPDRQIDRLCITCCSPSQPSHHAGCPARFRLSRKRDGFLVSLASGHHGPDHSRDLVGERDSRNLGRPPRQQGG
jgi:hypothetical protein